MGQNGFSASRLFFSLTFYPSFVFFRPFPISYTTMSKLHQAQFNQGHSKHFFEYIRSIGETKSKQEEDKIVVRDLIALKQSMSDKHPDKKGAKELVMRMIYAEMLGHSAEFGHIQGVNLASNGDLLAKRVGYLATWLCVNPEHEFMYLIVASIQRDMKSSNFLEISAALTAACKLIKPELMACINAEVVGLMSHTHPLVRKKAVTVMHSFYKKSDGTIGDPKVFRAALCDRDPAVMGASLALFYDVCLHDPAANRDLVPSFVSILKQIMEHRLARDYDYHRVPAPWMQIKLLKLIALLAADDTALSQRASEALGEVIKRADTGLSIGHAVVYECVSTITSISPLPELIEAAAECTSKMLSSQSSNLRYLGITALSRIVKIDTRYAQEHQGIVINCLEDSDDAIRRKTLALLFAMCNENNVEAISGRLLKFLSGATDIYLRQYLVKSLCNVAERFAPTNEWYIGTMNRLLELAPEHVASTTVQGMLRIIAEGDGEDEAADAQFRTQCVENYFALAESPDRPLSNQLYQVISWVIGEYGFLTKRISRAMLLDRLCDIVERVEDAGTRQWVVTAMMKLVAFNSAVPENVEEVIGKLQNSRNVALQQRCYEFSALVKVMPYLKKVQPLDGCCEDLEVDVSLSFLDSIVEDALARGAKPYEKKEVRLGLDKAGTELRTDAYKSQQANVVDEQDLNMDKFNEDEEKLIIKDTARRWGAKNLENEAAVERGPVLEDPADAPIIDATAGGAANSAVAAADVPAEVRKPTKNEKFLSDIFGAGGGTGGKGRKTRKQGDRAKEAMKRYEEAEQAHREGDDEPVATTTAAAAPPPRHADPLASLGVPASSSPASAAPPSAAGASSGPVKLEFNFQRQLQADCMLVRVGILAHADVQGAVMQLAAPPATAIEIVDPPNLPITSAINLPPLAAGKPLFMVVRVKATAYPLGGGLGVQVKAPGNPAPTVGGFPLSFVDLLRQTLLTTEAFGKLWVSLAANEAKVQLVFPKQLTPELLSQFFAEKASIKIIQVIGRECIAGATVVPSGQPLLVHLTVENATAVCTVRSQAKDFSDIASRVLLSSVPKA